MSGLSQKDGIDLNEDFEARDDEGILVAYCAVEGNLPPIFPGEGRSVLLASQTGFGGEYGLNKMGMHTIGRESRYALPEEQARRVLERYQSSRVE